MGWVLFSDFHHASLFTKINSIILAAASSFTGLSGLQNSGSEGSFTALRLLSALATKCPEATGSGILGHKWWCRWTSISCIEDIVPTNMIPTLPLKMQTWNRRKTGGHFVLKPNEASETWSHLDAPPKSKRSAPASQEDLCRKPPTVQGASGGQLYLHEAPQLPYVSMFRSNQLGGPTHHFMLTCPTHPMKFWTPNYINKPLGIAKRIRDLREERKWWKRVVEARCGS